MIVSLYIENEKLDLFNDETIEVNSSVADVNDITKNKTDFTKNFSVPASEINNRIFKHYYDASLDNGFDARTKVSGRIEIDGFVYRYGKFSLLGAKVKQGKPSSYNIIFYGNLVSLPELLKDDELSSLDLSAYNHEYNSDNVKDGLESSLFSGAIVYPLFAKKQYFYNSNSSDHTDNDSLSNIAHHSGHSSNIHGVRWSDLRPSISLLPIIEAIETKYGITFSRDFFGRTEFTNLYLWLNNTTQNNLGGGTEIIDWDSGNTTYINLSTNIATISKISTQITTIIIQITPEVGFENTDYTILIYRNGDLVLESSQSGYKQVNFNKTEGGTNEYSFYIRSENTFSYQALAYIRKEVSETLKTTFASVNTVASNVDISLIAPKIKVIDFLKGLFNMFKLVVIQDNNTEPIYVNTLKDYYSEGKLYDVTQYISTSEYDVERGKLLNEILYKFQEPTTILNKEFKLNVGQGYGDEELKLEDEDGKPLEGEKQDYSVPFEQIVYERLNDVNDGSETNIMYGAIVDEKVDPANPKPHLHYVVNNSIGPKTISFIDDTNSEVELTGNINLPSHTLGFDAPEFSTVFGKELNEYTKEIIENTLYSNYHSEYITSIFNFKRRNFKFEAKLPLYILLKLKLNDVLKIKEDYYRINSFTYNLMTGKTKFDLINSFDNTITP